ncbi:HK97 family phage prohead protease [Terrihabitans sp. B22-R8]|uniref:HK97 family phage prohead protease n=1 Tax=Terrihabitans sp. B22-R8 TaxID=3425128 RepID=UPI00403CACAA
MLKTWTPVEETKKAPRPPKAVARGGVIAGYASLFGETDLGGDLVVRGAFADSLRRNGAKRVRMLFQHDPMQPIGVWDEIREDSMGLRVRGRLALRVPRAAEIWALIQDGAIDGLSIGFKTIGARRDPRTRVRRLEKVDLWEISVVTFPMLPEARIAAAKSLTADAPKRPPGFPVRRTARAEAEALFRHT